MSFFDDMKFDNAYGLEETKLRSDYPNEPLYTGLLPEGDRSFWYSGDVCTLYPGSRFPSLPARVETVGFGVDAPYWNPSESMKEHMRIVASEKASKDRLVRVASRPGKQCNPNFRRFPAEYALHDPSLGDHEIDDTIRVQSLTRDRLVLERANYLDQLSTNIAPDRKPEGQKRTLRARETLNGRLAPLRQESCLANTLGSALVLIDRHGFPILRFRGRPEEAQQRHPGSRLAVMARGWHCAASGVMKWDDLDFSSPGSERDLAWLVRGMETGMWRELREETGLCPEDGIQMHPIAFARELKRAGKPNFFFVARASTMSREEIQEAIEARNPPDKDEYSQGESRPPNSLRDRFTVLIKSIRGTLEPASFFLPNELHLGRLAERGAGAFGDCPTTGFTYEGYASLCLAAVWWAESGQIG